MRTKYTKRKDGTYMTYVIIDGKRKYVYGHTKKEVDQKLVDLSQKQIKSHQLMDRFDDFLDGKNDIESSSYYTYKTHRRLLADYWGEELIEDIDSHRVQDFLTWMARRGYSHKTIAGYRVLLGQVFNQAVFDGLIQNNVVSPTRVPKSAPKGKRELPNKNDIATIKEHTDEQFGLFLYTLMYTGLRRGEALALQYSDFDFEHNCIHVQNNVVFQYSNKSELHNYTKTQAGIRQIPLLPQLKEKLPKKWVGLLFSDDGNLYTHDTYYRDYHRFADKYGITVTAHQLRHEYATILYDAGIDIKSAQGLLGHSTYQLTADIYTHIRAERTQDAYDKLTEYLK